LLSSVSVASVLVTGLGVAAALVFTRAGMPRAYALSKTVASLGFIGTALAVGAEGATWSSLALCALILSAAGDVALTVRGKKGFLVGLVCFAVAHSVYVAAFNLYGTSSAVFVVTTPIAALLAGGTWLWLRYRLPRPMRMPVGAYVLIVATMLAVGIAAGITHRAWLLVCGVLLVVGSDIAVGRERFQKPTFVCKLLGLPAYYAGQSLIALSLAGP
jgi:uncharacterized membrane protein YhhN